MAFLMDGLDAEQYDRIYADRDLLRRIIHYFRPHAGGMALVAGGIVAQSLTQAAVPVLISWGLDQVVGGAAAGFVALLTVLMLLAGGLAWLFNLVQRWWTAKTVGEVVLALRRDGFNAAVQRDMSFFDQYSSGKVVSRVSSDTEDFATVVTLTMNLVGQVLLVGLVIALLFARSVPLALLVLAVTPVVVGLALGFRRIARRSTRHAQRSIARVNSMLQETMSGISVAKSFRQEQTIYDEFRPVNEQNYRVSLRQGFVFGAIFPLLFAVAGLATVLLVQVGGAAAIGGGASVVSKRSGLRRKSST